MTATHGTARCKSDTIVPDLHFDRVLRADESHPSVSRLCMAHTVAEGLLYDIQQLLPLEGGQYGEDAVMDFYFRG